MVFGCFWIMFGSFWIHETQLGSLAELMFASRRLATTSLLWTSIVTMASNTVSKLPLKKWSVADGFSSCSFSFQMFSVHNRCQVDAKMLSTCGAQAWTALRGPAPPGHAVAWRKPARRRLVICNSKAFNGFQWNDIIVLQWNRIPELPEMLAS